MACGFAEVSYFLGLEWVGRFPSCSSSAAFVAGQKLQVGVVDNADRLGCLGILEKEGRPLPQWPSGWPRIVRMPFDAGGTCDWALSAAVFFCCTANRYILTHTHTHGSVRLLAPKNCGPHLEHEDRNGVQSPVWTRLIVDATAGILVGSIECAVSRQ